MVTLTVRYNLQFNDKGESIPWQGGTNEEVVFRLYDALRPLRKEQHLSVYWYTGALFLLLYQPREVT